MKRILLSLAAVLPLCAGCANGQGPFHPVAATGDGMAIDAGAPAPGSDAASRALYLRLVQSLEEQGKNYAALAYLDDYQAKYRDDGTARLLRAQALVAVAKLDEAAAGFRGLLGGEFKPAAQDGLGQVAAARGDWAAARDAFRQAAKLSPTNAKFLNNYSFALLKTGDLATAEFSLRQATELAPANDEIRDNLILCLHLEGKDAESDALLRGRPADKRPSITAALAQWAPPPNPPAPSPSPAEVAPR